MTQHTPGPWETSAGLADDGQTIEWEVCAPGGGDMVASFRGNDNAEADANLTAAAPAMLAALCTIASKANAAGNDELTEIASAAITAATGGTPTAPAPGATGEAVGQSRRYVSAIIRKNWEPRLSCFDSMAELWQDALTYARETVEIEDLADDATIDQIADALGEEAHEQFYWGEC